MNYLSMGLPNNYTSHPLYQQYAQMIMNSAQMTQQMMLQRQQQLAQQQALYQQHLQQQAAQAQAEQQALAQQQASELEQSQAMAEQQALAAAGVTDGCDDGKISFGSKVKNLGKGVVNFFKGMVCDENGKFSLKRTLTTATVAVGAAALTFATGGAAAPFLVAAGATMGVFEVGKGVYKAATAKTDAEAEAAWQNIGSGATAVVGSVAGAKSALKSAKVDVSGYKGIIGALKATGKSFKYSFDTARSGVGYVKANGISASLSTAKTKMSANFKEGWESAFRSNKAKDNAKAHMEAKYDSKIAKIEAKAEKLSQEIAALQQDPVKNAAKITQKQNKLSSILHDKTVLETRKAGIPETVQVRNNQTRIAELDNDIASLKQELDFYKQTLPDADVSVVQKELASKMALKNKLVAEQTTSGMRQVQIERLEANKVNLENAIKNATSKSTKHAYQKQLDNLNTRIAEVKRFSEIENAQQVVAASKAKIRRAENLVNSLNQKIEALKANTLISAEDKATQLTQLTARLNKANKVLNSTKSQLAKGKRVLHWNNVKTFEAMNRKSLGYPTVAITGGGVTTQSQINAADAYAQANGFNSAEEMQQYLDAQNAQNQQALADATAQQAITQATNPYAMPYTNPYGSQNFFSNNQYLGFNDLYVSPYPDMF